MTDEREYMILSESWYSDAVKMSKPANFVDDVIISYRGEDGSFAEVVVEWKVLGGKTCAHLGIFDESWGMMFGVLLPLLQDLRSSEGITVKEFTVLLERHGFVDATEREGPYK